MDKNSVISALNEYADRSLPDMADLRPTVLSNVRKVSVPQMGRGFRLGFSPRALVLAGLMLVLLIAGAVVFPGLLVQTKPASAAEILARAGAASQPDNLASNTNGVRSTHAIMSLRYRNNPTDQFVETQSEWWDQAPDKSRTETTFSTSDGKSSKVVVGRIGTISYIPWAGGKEFRIQTRSSAATSLGTDLGSATQLASSMGSLDVYDAVLTGTEAIAGRMAYVLALTMKSSIKNAPGGFTPAHYRKKVWIDQQTYLVLREQGWDKNGVLLYESLCQRLEVNPNLAASVFEFKPSADAIVADTRPATDAEIESGWKEVAGKLSTPVFRASATSYSDWVAGRPYYEPSQGVVSQAFTQHTSRSLDSGGILNIVISEGPPSAPNLSVQDWGAGTQVQIGALQGRMYSKGRAYALIFDRDGTRIMIYAPGYTSTTKSTLIPIAETMQPISRK